MHKKWTFVGTLSAVLRHAIGQVVSLS